MMSRIALTACLAALFTGAIVAQPVTFNFSGHITSASTLLPVGTPFTGQYTYNPAAAAMPACTVAGFGLCTYPQPAGSFTINVPDTNFFGSLGTLTGNSGVVATVRNNVPIFSTFVQDEFNISATGGMSTGFGGNPVNWAGTSIDFGTSAAGTAPPLTDKSLTGVPNTLAAWGAGNIRVFISNFVKNLPFQSTTSATGTIESISPGPLPASIDPLFYWFFGA